MPINTIFNMFVVVMLRGAKKHRKLLFTSSHIYANQKFIKYHIKLLYLNSVKSRPTTLK